MTSTMSMSGAATPQPTVDLGAEYNPFEEPILSDPYPFYARARREQPLFWSPLLNAWVVSRYDDLRTIMSDHARFSSADTLNGFVRLAPETIQVLRRGYLLPRYMINSDPPDHGRLRRGLSKFFSPRRLDDLRPEVERVTGRLIDGFQRADRVELIAELTHPLPLQIILHLVGVPREDMDQISRWSGDLFALRWESWPVEQQIQYATGVVSFQHYCAELIERRRVEPDGGLLSYLVDARERGEVDLSDAEIVSMITGSLLAAGHETSRAMIANAVRTLLERPERWANLSRDPAKLAGYVDECLRFDSTTLGFLRTTTEEVELHGRVLPAGARVFMLHGSANRDESCFPDPDRFDPDRPNLNEALSFGFGIHRCLGAHLAQLELHVALEQLLERLPEPKLSPDQRFSYHPSLAIRGLKQLWIEWSSSARVGVVTQ